ncbi:MAG TPA: DUF92 domain-containing protein [Thermoanaerobaculia bacterium]|nr:DUF92 domain-containing protein [Thermoanaerobaculia bacterium]
MNEHTTNETLRKSIHIGTGFLAITLKWLPWRIAAAIAALAAIGNWLVLHRIVGKRIARHQRGYDAGIVLYPLAVCALILTFNWHIELAAVGWVILAFGDGFATVIGRALPIAPLPWNRTKSWGGTLGFVGAAALAGGAIAQFFGGPSLLLVAVAVIIAAFVESMPLGLDDNVSVPAAAAATLAVLSIQPMVGEIVHAPIPWPWIALNTILAIVGYGLRTVDLSGFITGWLLGTIVILGGGPPMYVALLAFFIVGTACTRLGYARKARAGLAQEKGGRRGAGHAFANVGVAAICSVAVWRGLGLVPLFMGITSLATAAADTAGSEVGQLIGRRAFHPLTFRRVERGTDGAMSLEGTLAGVLGALIVAIAGTAMAVHHIRPAFIGTVTIDKARAIAVVTISAILGSYIESVIGSLTKNVNNHVMNFLNTAIGAILFWVAWNFVPMFGFEF